VTSASPNDRLNDAALWYARIVQGPLSEQAGLEFDRWLSNPDHLQAFTEISECWEDLGPPAGAYSVDTLPSVAGGLQPLASVDNAEVQSEVTDAPISSAWHKTSRRWFIGGGVITALAASVALLLMPSAGPALGPLDLQSDHGERRSTTLADGSVITLDGGSRVLVDGARSERAFALTSGRALFQVQSEKRPFVVETGGVTVTATGTRFSVERLRDQVQVELYEGGIIVRSPAHQLEQAVKPVSRLIVFDDGRAPVLMSLKDGRGETWARDDKVVLVNETLAVAADRMARMSTQRIEVDPSVASLRVSGVFTGSEIDGFVDAVTALLNVHAEAGEGGVRFVSRQAGGAAHPEK
jgi:transmembrane sensor